MIQTDNFILYHGMYAGNGYHTHASDFASLILPHFVSSVLVQSWFPQHFSIPVLSILPGFIPLFQAAFVILHKKRKLILLIQFLAKK